MLVPKSPGSRLIKEVPIQADGSPVSGNYRKGDRTIPSAKPEWAITVDPGRYLPNYEVDPVIRIRASPDAEVLPVSRAFHQINPAAQHCGREEPHSSTAETVVEPDLAPEK